MAQAARKPRKIVRAEAVGSLLRPASVKTALASVFEDQTSAMRALVPPERAGALRDLTALIDREVHTLIARQIECGLDVISDGELRRPYFYSPLYESTDGWAAPDERIHVEDEDGNTIYETFGEPVIAAKLHKVASPLVEEVSFMRAATDYPFKITLPAPSYWYSAFATISTPLYAKRDQLIHDIVEIEKELVSEAVAAGAKYIQFDFPVYPALVDEYCKGHMLEGLGMTENELLQQALAADIAVTRGIPEGVTVALHLCRGNTTDGFWNGSLAPIAERMFSELPHNRFLFEWENTDREGDYQPIKYVRSGQIMAMGLVSTKNAAMESDDLIMRQLDEAAKYLPMEQLALSTQCGFASTFIDIIIGAEEAQWRKLAMIGRVADRIWGQSS